MPHRRGPIGFETATCDGRLETGYSRGFEDRRVGAWRLFSVIHLFVSVSYEISLRQAWRAAFSAPPSDSLRGGIFERRRKDTQSIATRAASVPRPLRVKEVISASR